MREIKFRAWDKLNKNMIVPKGSGVGFVDVADFITMQYTGLKDKNGKEIFEGDIVYWGNGVYPHVVYWDEHGASFRCHPRGTMQYDKTKGFISGMWLEVIGNVFENPELIQT